MIDLVLWDLDETLLSTATLKELRHAKLPCDLTSELAFADICLHDGVGEIFRRVTVPRCGLVTSSPRWYVEQILGSHLPDVFFDVIVTYEDVANIKPDPEALQLAMARLGVPPERTLYIGDDIVDQQACVASGVRFAGAGWTGAATFPRGTEILRHPLDLVLLLAAA